MKYFTDKKATQPTDTKVKAQVSVLEKYNLTDEQMKVIQALEEGKSVVVDSVIGSGKTRVLQAVCDHFPHQRILYLTYNRLLKLDAQEKIHNSNATVQNYHGFVYKYLSRRNIHVQPSKQIKAFLTYCKDIPLIYDICLIDEFQDIEEDTTELLLHLKNECPRAQWVFVGDMQQKIYDKTKIDVYKDCINKIIPDYTPLKFTKSFRISSDWGGFLSRCWQKQISGVNENCQVTTTRSFQDVLNLLDTTPNKDILILGPRYGITPEIVNLLEQHDKNKYNKNTVWTSIQERDEGYRVQPDSLIVTTYDGCKGMERPICIVVDWTAHHFQTRVEQPFVDKDIIRNLFCVAASRGKDKIIFLEEPRKPLFTEDTLYQHYSQRLPDFNPCSMFDFKHTEDVLKCMEHLTIEDIPQEDTTEIKVHSTDGNIDLSPAIGRYQEILFFNHFDFEKEMHEYKPTPLVQRVAAYIGKIPSLSKEQQALALTSCDTELFRYIGQVTTSLIDEENKDKLMKRLSSKLNPNNKKIQVSCHIVSNFTATGLADYVENGIPWELKFIANLTNSNYLQAVMYSIMLKAPYAMLWNVRTNELKKVSVKDKAAFLKDVYKCITLGRTLRRY